MTKPALPPTPELTSAEPALPPVPEPELPELPPLPTAEVPLLLSDTGLMVSPQALDRNPSGARNHRNLAYRKTPWWAVGVEQNQRTSVADLRGKSDPLVPRHYERAEKG